MKRKRCLVTKRQGKLLPCWGLSEALDSGKGVRYRQLFKLKRKFAEGESFATLHSGVFARRGVVINYCPFCGNDIGSHITKRSKKPKGRNRKESNVQRLREDDSHAHSARR